MKVREVLTKQERKENLRFKREMGMRVVEVCRWLWGNLRTRALEKAGALEKPAPGSGPRLPNVKQERALKSLELSCKKGHFHKIKEGPKPKLKRAHYVLGNTGTKMLRHSLLK